MEIDKIADAAAEVIHDGPDHADNDTGEDDAPYAFPAAVETANAQHGTDMCATVGRSPEADIDSLAMDQEPTPMEEVEHHTPVPIVTPKTSTRRSKPDVAVNGLPNGDTWHADENGKLYVQGRGKGHHSD
ncbi:hypothetical protein PRIC2_011704 [Phytophthora ramorum]